MKRFAQLYAELDETTATNAKIAALERYFSDAAPADAAWAVHFLGGRRPKRLVRAADLRSWAAEAAGIPDWLFDESYQAVGDLAETIALLLPPEGATTEERSLTWWVEERLLALRGLPDQLQREMVLRSWSELDFAERFVWTKLVTGAFRVGASQRLVIRAIARASGVAEEAVAHRLMGAWDPTPEFFARLVAADTRDSDVSRPYPFYLAYPLEQPPEELGPVGEWQLEWKWDGIRAQVIRRGDRTFIWSRGEDLLAGRFPEIEETAAFLPDGTVLDGEIMPWSDDTALPFAQLQRRIGRRNIGPKILAEVPVVLLAYDVLECAGRDVRELPLDERRSRLAALVAALPSGGAVRLSPLIEAGDWAAAHAARDTSRARRAEGLMLKRRAAGYGVGRRRGDWWKWKITPYTVDAVLIYAQPGSGRRAGLYTDYTFGVWDGDRLVPFAKAYSGLTDEEIRRVDAFVRRNTTERFGPVRVVEPHLVFELAFEGIQRSTRHRSGVAVRFPRMSRWRHDKRPADADTIDTVRALLETPA